MKRSKIVSISGTGRGVGYVRVSTGKQALSPEAQEEKIRALATLQGAQLVACIVDRESGKEGSIHKREGIIRVLRMAAAGEIDRVIIAKLDRLTRSVVDLGAILNTLDKHRVALASATETWMDTGSAAGRMIVNIITCVAQWEREAIAERTAAVLQYKKAHNKAYNHTPYGYERQGNDLVALPAEQLIITKVRKLRKLGKALRAIAEGLNAEGVPTKIGGKWHASSVANLLRAA